MNIIEQYNADPIYENSLRSEKDVNDFKLEGQAAISFPQNRLRMENKLAASEGQKANFVFWCPKDFPESIAVTWDFWPIREPGLCMIFFGAKGMQGEDLFDPGLKKREGEYGHYTHGDINAYHLSYFRRIFQEARGFHTCNLRKSNGFHLVAQGADPIPDVADAVNPYRIALIKCHHQIRFFVNELLVLEWNDDRKTYGPVLGEGKIGFRQMSPLTHAARSLQSSIGGR
jgi:hypothetical protein